MQQADAWIWYGSSGALRLGMIHCKCARQHKLYEGECDQKWKRKSERARERESERARDRETERQRDRETERQTDEVPRPRHGVRQWRSTTHQCPLVSSRVLTNITNIRTFPIRAQRIPSTLRSSTDLPPGTRCSAPTVVHARD